MKNMNYLCKVLFVVSMCLPLTFSSFAMDEHGGDTRQQGAYRMPSTSSCEGFCSEGQASENNYFCAALRGIWNHAKAVLESNVKYALGHLVVACCIFALSRVRPWFNVRRMV